MSTLESLQVAITQLQGRYDDMESRLSYYFQQFSEQRSRMDSLSITLGVLDERTNKIRLEVDMLNEDTARDVLEIHSVIHGMQIDAMGDDE